MTKGKTEFPRKLNAFMSPSGNLLPSTIRERAGDCESALLKTYDFVRRDSKPANIKDYTLITVYVYKDVQNAPHEKESTLC